MTYGASAAVSGLAASSVEEASAAGPCAPAEGLWREHGWALSGWAVGAVVALVVLASCAVQLLG